MVNSFKGKGDSRVYPITSTFKHDSASQLRTAGDEPYPIATMFAINRRQLYQIARRRGNLGLIRGNASQAGELATKSPREVCCPLSHDRRS